MFRFKRCIVIADAVFYKDLLLIFQAIKIRLFFSFSLTMSITLSIVAPQRIAAWFTFSFPKSESLKEANKSHTVGV